jgi:hypothetical protein
LATSSRASIMARHVKHEDVIRLANALGVERVRKDSVVRLFLRCVEHAERSAVIARELAPSLEPPGGVREGEATAEETAIARRECRHKFVDSNNCARCGVHVEELRAAHRAELAEFEQGRGGRIKSPSHGARASSGRIKDPRDSAGASR